MRISENLVPLPDTGLIDAEGNEMIDRFTEWIDILDESKFDEVMNTLGYVVEIKDVNERDRSIIIKNLNGDIVAELYIHVLKGSDNKALNSEIAGTIYGYPILKESFDFADDVSGYDEPYTTIRKLLFKQLERVEREYGELMQDSKLTLE